MDKTLHFYTEGHYVTIYAEAATVEDGKALTFVNNGFQVLIPTPAWNDLGNPQAVTVSVNAASETT